MIIRSLQAENLLRYRILGLYELPERGVIAVSGNNETGKSAIGEIICFALFGRTYSLGADELRKLVRWGEVQGRVNLRISAKDQELEIIRQVDRGGEQSARLVLVDQPQEPVARGVAEVNEHMERILGYDFAEYIDTFYLAQREITTPHPHSPSMKAMAGILPFEHCIEEVGAEIERDNALASRLEGEIAEVQRELAQLSPDRLCLDDMEIKHAHTVEQERQLAERIGTLDAAVDGYCRALVGVQSHTFRRALAGGLQSLVLLLLLAAVGVWTLWLVEPQLWPLPAIRKGLEGQLAVVGLPLEAALLYLIVALVGILLLTWLWIFNLNLGIRRRRSRARHLGEALQSMEDLEHLRLPTELQIETGMFDSAEHPLEPRIPVDKPDSERRLRLVDRILDLEATSEEVRAAARHEVTWMESGRRVLAGQQETQSQHLTTARRDKEREQQLQNKKQTLSKQLADGNTSLETKRLAHDLLKGAMRQVADRFNTHLRTLVSRNLPKFTDGHYEYLQLDDDLRIRVYSNEKRSYLDLEEISSGTQRQIMLALRLALAQEQMSRIAKDCQFAFLDEPFAFFDDTRMRNALRLLPELSDLIGQHWVVAQRFPRDEFVALEIPCGSHPDTLEIGIPPQVLRQ